jgi:glutamyl/glutaminyl-tRNA synthetase
MDHADIKKWNIGKDLRKDLKTHKGKIVTRFPPEPSGFFHIGHAKALFINYVVSKYNDCEKSFPCNDCEKSLTCKDCENNGQLLIRFDDTNPSKESNVYTQEIIKDIESLIGGDFKQHITYTSDYFSDLIESADYLVSKGLAYIDETSPDQVKKERLEKIESKYRNASITENEMKWSAMKKGELNAILRLKIQMNHLNGCMRDPTIYRAMNDTNTHHDRTGDTYKIYPTYDFACPIVDAYESVTHVFRSTEFTDRDEQYKWILDSLGMKCPLLYGYGKLTFKGAVLSKRKIRDLIDNKVVDSWDSPKLLTLQGIRRRGLCNKGLICFLDKIGITRSVVEMTQDLLWYGNQKVIDKIATRYQVIPIPSQTIIDGGYLTMSIISIVDFDNNSMTTTKIDKFNRCKELGTRDVFHSRDLYIDESDPNNKFDIGEEITLINWGNVICVDNHNLRADNHNLRVDSSTSNVYSFKLNIHGDFKTTKKKVLWIAKDNYTKIDIVYYSHDINDQPNIIHYYGEYDMRNLKKGDYVQLMRMNYYICDREFDGNNVVLIELPLPE